MAKLPPEFVKPLAPPSKPRRKPKKTNLMTAERALDLLREVILRLTEEEHRELEKAREELKWSGEDVSLEQIVHRVVAEWCAGRRTQRAAAAAPRPVDGIIAQLRRFARSPLRTWRDLGAAIRLLAPSRLA